MSATTPRVGTPGTSIAAQCVGPDVGTKIQAADVGNALLSIENDIATVSAGDVTIGGHKTWSGVATFQSTVEIDGLLSADGGVEIPTAKALTLDAGSSTSFQTNVTMGNSPATFAISGATNATPIVITTTSAHGYGTGDQVVVSGVGGNTNANGTWVIALLTGTTFSLIDSAGNSAYTSGGSVKRLPQVGVVAGRTVTRTLGASWNDGVDALFTQGWTTSSDGVSVNFVADATITQQYFGWNITPGDCPQGSSLTGADAWCQPPSGHGAVPGTVPSISVYKRANATGSPTTIGTGTDTNTGSVMAYEVYTKITSSLGSAEIIDHTRYRYYVVLNTETGANAKKGTSVFTATATFIPRAVDQF